MAFSCDEENDDPFKSAEGYIVASFRCGETDSENGQATGDLTKRGFFIMLENKADSMYSFSLPENLFDFPQEILTDYYDWDNCGPTYFTTDQEYKIRFKYRVSNDSERIHFLCGPCGHLSPPFEWGVYKQVIIEEITKINP